MEEGPYKARLRERIAGLPPLQKVMLDLDVALTGHEPEDVVRQYHHYPNSLEHWIQRDGWQFIWYLSDGGYSRVVWHEESGNLSLTDNSRREVKARWDAAAPQRQAVAAEMQRQWDEMGSRLESLVLDSLLDESPWTPDRLGQLYTKLYNRADKELKRTNPCHVTKDAQGNHVCVACRNHPEYPANSGTYGHTDFIGFSVPPNELCCGGCQHHGPGGCTAQEPATCKTWLCGHAAARAPETAKRLRKISNTLGKHNLWAFRGDRAKALQYATQYPTRKLEALRLADFILEVFEPGPQQIAWARQFLSMMREGSVWQVPATGQVYQISHKDKTLTLIDGPVADPRNWHEMNKVLFSKVGYRVLPDTGADEQSFSESLLAESPQLKTLKARRRSLSPEEKRQAGDAPVWKANVNGRTWYVCNTHRCFQARPTLKGAVHAWHHGVEQSG